MVNAVDSEVTPKKAPQQSVRVLIVDDDPSGTGNLRRSLHLNGYRVHEVNDSRVALAAARGFEPHVVILDVPARVLHKEDLAWQFASNPDLAHTRLVVSNLSSINKTRRILTPAAIPIVQKPADLDDLLRLIDTRTSERLETPAVVHQTSDCEPTAKPLALS